MRSPKSEYLELQDYDDTNVRNMKIFLYSQQRTSVFNQACFELGDSQGPKLKGGAKIKGSTLGS